MQREKMGITVFTATMAKALLRQGYRIMDIKPSREDSKRTWFIFVVENDIQQAIRDFVALKSEVQTACEVI